MFSTVIAKGWQAKAQGELMRRRSAIVEHPFGTLKCRAGYQHFLVRGFDKVRGEWSLMALCTTSPACSTFSLRPLRRVHGRKGPRSLRKRPCFALRSIPLVLQTFQANIALWLAVVTLRATPAP